MCSTPSVATAKAAPASKSSLVFLRNEIEHFLRELTFSIDPATAGLAEVLRYSLFAGGKRVRPVLALATARVLGMDHRSILPLAAGIELIHTSTLIHDDLPAMDGDDLRRGRPTSHRVFGEGLAVLGGDALIAEAFRLLLRVDAPADRALLAAQTVADAIATDGVAGGQFMDLAGTASDEEAVLHMHGLKTGRLIEATVASVVALARPASEIADGLANYAAHLGLLFQIVDDVLDAVGTAAETGKPGRSDDRNGRRTLIVDGEIDRALHLADGAFAAAVDAVAPVPGDTGEMLGIARLVRDRVA